jgi:hypothetical protein
MDAYGSGWAAASWDEASPPLAGELSFGRAPAAPAAPPQPLRRARASQRIGIELGAGLRQRGAAGVSVQIMDLSTHGFRAATHLDLPPGTDVWLRLPGLEACHARVAWQEGHYVGCAFERPLHPAVLDMVVNKAKGAA